MLIVRGSSSTEVVCVVVATEPRHAPNVHAIDEAPTREGDIAIVIVGGAEVSAMLEQKPDQENLKQVCMYIVLCDEQSYTIVSTFLLQLCIVLGSFTTEAMCVAVATEQRHAPNVHAVNEVDLLVGNIAMVIVSGAMVYAI